MKKFLIFAIIIFFTINVFSTDDDLLTIGKSKNRFDIGKIEKGQIVDTKLNKKVTMEEMVKSSLKSDVFVIGEMHISYDCHKFQADFIEALFKAYPKIIIGFEFFQRKDDPVLEKWRLGKITEDELLKETGWFEKGSYHYYYTKMIMDLARKYKIKLAGLNIPRTILRKTSRKGFATLTKEEKKLFPTINVLNKDHRFFIQRVFGDFTMQMPPFWFNNMYSAQKIWDVVMAESMLKTLKKNKGYKGIIIAGNNHVVYKLGIPFRYNLSNKRARVTTIIPVYLSEKKDEDDIAGNPMMKKLKASLDPIGIYSRGIGDFVFPIESSSDNKFKKFGLKEDFKDNKFIVKSVAKKSAAEECGIKKGDIIKSVNGIEIKKKGQLGYYLYKNFGKTDLVFDITKEIKKKEDKKKEDKKKGDKKDK
ncbi:MAG: ChaN family lipoprotein, partial [Acidobacteriota bacterium]